MKLLTILACSALLALTSVLSACDGDVMIGNGSGLQHLRLHDGSLTAFAVGQPDAVITAAGDLSIDGKPVTLQIEQRALLQTFYAEVVAIHDAGIETGKEGAKLAGKAIGAAVSGLANGDPDSIDKKVNAQTDKIEASAMVICTRVAALRTTENQIAASVPAFKPYANIDAHEVDNCRAHDKVVIRP